MTGADAKKLVVKIGSSLLIGEDGKPRRKWLETLVHDIAKRHAAGASIIQGPEESVVAYSFTAVDPDGNQWWVNAETGFLDQLRCCSSTARASRQTTSSP